MTEELNRRLATLFQRGVMTTEGVKVGMAVMQGKFLGGDLRSVEVPQGYGHAARPKAGSELFAVFANGEGEHGVALGYDDRRIRPELKPGEAAQYGADIKAANGHSALWTDKPKAGTLKIRCSRIELRAGQYYVLLDADIGAQKGTFDPSADLPVNPGGAAL